MSERFSSGPSKPKRLAITMPVLALGTLVFFFLSLIALWWGWRLSASPQAALQLSKVTLEKQETDAEIAKKRATAEAELAVAWGHQTQMLDVIARAKASMQKTSASLDALRPQLYALRTNSLGRAIAYHSDLVGDAISLFIFDSTQLPSRESLLERIQTANRIELQLKGSLGTQFEPATVFQSEVNQIGEWAHALEHKSAQFAVLLFGLSREPEVRAVGGAIPASSETLDLVMGSASYRQNLAAFRPQPQQTPPSQVPQVDLAANQQQLVTYPARREVIGFGFGQPWKHVKLAPPPSSP